MHNQEIVNAYYGFTTIEALLYENFDAEPEWRQVKIKDVRINAEGIGWIEVMILKDGYPTPWYAVVVKDRFMTDLRYEQAELLEKLSEGN